MGVGLKTLQEKGDKIVKTEEHIFDFSTLSLKDLIEARDLYHFHLMSKANVVGTAIGLYLIRSDEDWPEAVGEGAKPKKKKSYARTLNNSEVRDYSWPCVLVLVREWLAESDFGQKKGPAPWDALPKRLYLPDGRVVPVCVVEAPPVEQAKVPATEPVAWPQATFGGGLPVYVEVQREMHRATLGCLVTDGHTLYALTARHACGEPGTEMQAMLRGGLQTIGVSSDKQLTRKLFSDVYPALPLRQTWLGLDIGLVRIEDARDWTANTYGLPPIKPLFDLYEQNLSLRRLLDRPVVAIGAASGLLEGKIKALFYRYMSVGGYDYVSDFLIAPKEDGAGAKPGDSGALWHLQMPGADGAEDKGPLEKRDLRPIAIEWGAQTFADGARRSTFSVATNLSNVCKLLDVELVVDHNVGVSGTWGAVGHYSIGTLAIDLVKNAKLRAFLEANAELISIPLDALKKAPKNKDLIDSGFVALADVPDIVWKQLPPYTNSKGQLAGVKGGRDTSSNKGPEHANHHCDADRPFKGSPTLPEACIADPTLITAANWNKYFDSFPETVGEMHRGILPFRVWQFFERMKDYAASEPERFLAAAGILAHYIGDASQPLHGSIYADGIEGEHPDIPRTTRERDGSTRPSHRGEGVHSGYETAMINMAANKALLFPEIRKNLGADHALPNAPDGRGAAVATLTLMHDVAHVLPPRTIIDSYEKTFHPDAPPRSQALWSDLGKGTGKVMALGARTLAMIWDAAWAAGGGMGNPGALDRTKVRKLYENPNFIRSVTVKAIEREIQQPTPL